MKRSRLARNLRRLVSVSRINYLILPAVLLLACERGRAPTPADVQARYDALIDTLSLETPGASAAYLEAFIRETRKYQVSDSAAAKVAVYRGATFGRYHQARELARDGEFDRAEAMLKDLARVDTEDGESARIHLEFDFYMEKARWLLIRQRFEEARAVGDWLLTQDLTPFQRDQAEKILDFAGQVDAAMSMVEGQNVMNACKQLIVVFATQYADNGYYPPTFSLADLDRLDVYTAKSIARHIATVDSYTSSQDHYRLVATGRDGRRYTIEDGEIK